MAVGLEAVPSAEPSAAYGLRLHVIHGLDPVPRDTKQPRVPAVHHRGRVTRAALQLGEERADVWPAADHRPLANLPPQGDGFQQAELGAGEDGDAAPGPPLRVGAYLAADRRQLGSPYS